MILVHKSEHIQCPPPPPCLTVNVWLLTLVALFNPIGPGGFEPNRDSNPIFKDGVRIHETESVLLSLATDVLMKSMHRVPDFMEL